MPIGSCQSGTHHGFVLHISRLSDLLSLWPDGDSTHRAESRAVVCFLRTRAGMKARLDLVRAYRSSVRGDNTEQGKNRIALSVCLSTHGLARTAVRPPRAVRVCPANSVSASSELYPAGCREVVPGVWAPPQPSTHHQQRERLRLGGSVVASTRSAVRYARRCPQEGAVSAEWRPCIVPTQRVLSGHCQDSLFPYAASPKHSSRTGVSDQTFG
jgi:hypothetical protein